MGASEWMERKGKLMGASEWKMVKKSKFMGVSEWKSKLPLLIGPYENTIPDYNHNSRQTGNQSSCSTFTHPHSP